MTEKIRFRKPCYVEYDCEQIMRDIKFSIGWDLYNLYNQMEKPVQEIFDTFDDDNTFVPDEGCIQVIFDTVFGPNRQLCDGKITVLEGSEEDIFINHIHGWYLTQPDRYGSQWKAAAIFIEQQSVLPFHFSPNKVLFKDITGELHIFKQFIAPIPDYLVKACTVPTVQLHNKEEIDRYEDLDECATVGFVQCDKYGQTLFKSVKKRDVQKVLFEKAV